MDDSEHEPAPGNTIRVTAERLVAGGDALARLSDGRVCFVPGLLPGETADVTLAERRADFARAEPVSVDDLEAPGPARVVPTCPHRRAGCGGCDWMHLDASRQLEAKAEIVAESLRRIGRFDAETVDRLVRPVASVGPFGYRTTIRLAGLGPESGGGVGFREERSAEVVPIDHCQVAHEHLAPVLRDVRVAPGVELVLRTSVATGAVSARWTTPQHRRRRGERRRPAPEAGPGGRVVDGLPDGVHIGDRAFIVERVAGVPIKVSAGSFFQSGVEAAELLVDAVTRAAPELARARHAVDAYGGVGLFAATAMRDVRHVTVLESSRSSCRDAEDNLDGRSASVVRGDVADWRRDPEAPGVDVVVADPARPGLAKPGVGALAALGAPVLVLVSCDPVSAARDAALLSEAGYRAETVEVFDLFPQTHHVETVTRFVRPLPPC